MCSFKIYNSNMQRMVSRVGYDAITNGNIWELSERALKFDEAL